MGKAKKKIVFIPRQKGNGVSWHSWAASKGQLALKKETFKQESIKPRSKK